MDAAAGGRFEAVVDVEARDVVESRCKCAIRESKPLRLAVSGPLPLTRDQLLADDFRETEGCVWCSETNE